MYIFQYIQNNEIKLLQLFKVIKQFIMMNKQFEKKHNSFKSTLLFPSNFILVIYTLHKVLQFYVIVCIVILPFFSKVEPNYLTCRILGCRIRNIHYTIECLYNLHFFVSRHLIFYI